ncbi:MAG: dihydrodipicolinate reductase [Novosphingobium sp.]|nr:dihydrodipicolinate reductase [Novosphingobium sp.]MCP5402837.1 dihydrodipicolinate reductase [Novosphingobium sp.]
MAGKKYRVIQWATGNVGSRALRTIIEHPDLELVGLWVSSDQKAGKDAGELCGLGAVGVKATTSAEDLIALEADCVSYMRQGFDCDETCAILESGKNIVSTLADLNCPAMLDADVRSRLEEACRKGGTSLHSTGSSPGFSTEALAIPLLSMQRRLDLMTIDEFADVSSRNSPEMLFQIMGFGQPMGEYEQRRADSLKSHFGNSMGLIAEAMGLAFDEIEASGEYAAALNTFDIAAGKIEAGTVGAMRTTITGKHAGKPVMRMRLNWYVTRDIDKQGWNLRENGWRVLVEGDTPLNVEITYPVADEDYAAFTPGLTAHRPVNAIPYVCEAEPGIRTTVDLPQVIPHF